MRADIGDLVDQSRTALRRVDDGARWAYGAGWWPSRRWVGDPPGRELRVAGSADDDRVPGPPDDVGLGDYRARAAVRRVGPGLTEASGHLHDATVVAACVGLRRQLPRPVSLPSVPTLAALAHGVAVVGAQLDVIAEVRPAPLTDLAARQMAGRMALALRRLDSLAAGLDRWAESVRPSRSLAVSLCRTCHCRPRPLDARGRLDGAECRTCATWRARHGGQTRPPSLDDDDRHAVAAAQSRRTAAGAGWGWG